MNLEFIECPQCSAKPGSPTLCPSCLSNRQLIEKTALAIKLIKELMDIDPGAVGGNTLLGKQQLKSGYAAEDHILEEDRKNQLASDRLDNIRSLRVPDDELQVAKKKIKKLKRKVAAQQNCAIDALNRIRRRWYEIQDVNSDVRKAYAVCEDIMLECGL